MAGWRLSHHLLCGGVQTQEPEGLERGLQQRQARRQLCGPRPEPRHLVQPPGHRPQQRWLLHC